MVKMAQIYNTCMVLDSSQNFISTQYLRKNDGDLTKFCIHVDIDKFQVGISLHPIPQFYRLQSYGPFCFSFLL